MNNGCCLTMTPAAASATTTGVGHAATVPAAVMSATAVPAMVPTAQDETAEKSAADERTRIPEGIRIGVGIGSAGIGRRRGRLYVVAPRVHALEIGGLVARLLPVGTLYDPFIERGLDALNYACYQDARFIVVATPSGVTLAPEGGATSRSPPR